MVKITLVLHVEEEEKVINLFLFKNIDQPCHISQNQE